MLSLHAPLLLLQLLLCIGIAHAGLKKNVLLIVVDDLRPNIGAYGASFMHTPSLDALANTNGSTTFTNAYVQYAFCGPSRNSFLTGRRPDATRAFSFMDHFREANVGDDWTSLPQYFKENNYSTYGVGKLFHPGLPPNFDAPKSFDNYFYPGSCNGTTNGWPVLEENVTNVICTKATQGCNDNSTGAIVTADSTGAGRWCSVVTSKLKAPLQDDQSVIAAQNFLDDVMEANTAEGSQTKPFFLGVGFHKPHLPFQYPVEFDRYYPDEVAPPKHPLPPHGMPLCAWHEGNFDNKWNKPCTHTSEYRRAYYAAVSYTDSNVGKVLAKLEATGLDKDTVILFIGDHGWQLGELNEWRKMTNFELGVRVPLIVRPAPSMGASTNKGRKSNALVEAVDIFPTLVALSGLPSVPPSEHLQGVDLSPLLGINSNKIPADRKYAFSQFAKQMIPSKELHRKVLWGECTKCMHADIDAMGYSVRTQHWRYTEWVRWNHTAFLPNWKQVVGRELYDHKDDDGSDFDRSSPTTNLWNASAMHIGISDNLSAVLKQQFNNDHLQPDEAREGRNE